MLKEIKALEEKLQELDKDYATVADINRQETTAAFAAKDQLVPLAVIQIANAQLHLDQFAAERWEALAQQLEAVIGT